MENKNENKKTNTEITEELIYKCEKTRKNNSKRFLVSYQSRESWYCREIRCYEYLHQR